MIEVIDAERCTACNICVSACPTNVFELVAGAPPVIARQADCQTCFMCEVYCPEDALYVSPEAEGAASGERDAKDVRQWMGGYREALGWRRGATSAAGADMSHLLLKLAH
ncbi:MAG: ferredoxin family protein [Pigmentiphaga sp.]|nr:ferredoxin family protein [Pigmentiphaga sp.]